MHKLAHQANETQQVMHALATVRKYEAKLQRMEEKRANSGAPRSSRNFSTLLFDQNAKKTPRKAVKHVINEVCHMLHRSLKRYTLRKRPTASFSMTISRDDFLSLCKGYGPIYTNPNTDDLQFRLQDANVSSSKACNALGKMLGRKWVTKRMYGKKIWQRRDCSHVAIVPENEQKNFVVAKWHMEQCRQIDIDGKERVTKRPKMLFRFPRATVPCDTSVPEANKREARAAHASKVADREARARVKGRGSTKRKRAPESSTAAESSSSGSRLRRYGVTITLMCRAY